MILPSLVLNTEEATRLGHNHVDIYKHDKNPNYVWQKDFIYEGINIPCSSKFLLYFESSVKMKKGCTFQPFLLLFLIHGLLN